MRILDVIQRSTDFLVRKGISSPRLQVELLLAHLLKMPRMQLYLNFERKLTDAEMDSLRALVVRRGQREPLQYIVGSTSFCGLEIAVNRDVLIPRPETELLAERAWTFLQKIEGEVQALDIGAGSGCLAIALAHHAPKAKICAVDCSDAALAVARGNAENNHVSERIQFCQGDLFPPGPVEARFDLIVSNPPYIPSARIGTLEPEVRDYEPRGALDGGEDGQDFYRRIARGASAWLKPGGCMMLELDDEGAAATAQIFENEKWTLEAVQKDYDGHARILVARMAEHLHDKGSQPTS